MTTLSVSTKFSTLALQRPSQTLASKKLQIHAAYKGLDGAQSNAQWGWIEKLFILSSLVCIGDMCKKFAVLGKFFARAVLSLSLVNNSYVLYRLEDLYFASRRAKNGPVRHETLIRAVTVLLMHYCYRGQHLSSAHHHTPWVCHRDVLPWQQI